MNIGIVDIMLILITILGIYIGWKRGLIKESSDFVILFISMLLAGLLKTIVSNSLYGFLPFFSYKGLYSVSFLMYQTIIYIFLIILFVAIFQMISLKTRIHEMIEETIISSNNVFSILGAVLGAPLIILLMYNILLIFNIPNINFKYINDSKYANVIMKNTIIIRKVNKNLYDNDKYIIKIANDKNNKVKYLDYKIINHMIENNLISSKSGKKIINDYNINKGGIINDKTRK